MFKLVDSFPTETTSVTLPLGQSYDAPVLVEGPDASRYLIVASEKVPVSVWASAKLAGFTGVIKPAKCDWPKAQYVSLSYFEEQCQVLPDKGIYQLPSFLWDEAMPDAYMTDYYEENLAVFKPEPVESSSDEDLNGLFVNLHTHAEYSALDGYSKITEMVDRAVEMGQVAVAITDHGICSGHPTLQVACDEAGIKPIFGLEAYLVPDRFSREDLYSYHHLVLWAMDDEGLQNLWAMSTESWRDGEYGRYPRLDYDTLRRFNKGVMASTACLRGPVTQPYLKGNTALALQNLSVLKDIFGDRLYIEIHANHLEDQIKANKWLVARATEFEIPLVAAMDSHYTHKHERDDHQVWIAMQVGDDVNDDTALFGGGQDYHLASFDEMLENLAYLGDDAVQAIQNTRVIADRCTARMKPKSGLPRYSVGVDAEQQDIDKLFDLCLKNWDERVKGKTQPESVYLARFEMEMDLLVRKGFPGYFLMNADLVGYAKDNGVLVGPGRGSGAGSLVAYLCGITEVDPVENDLLFERFMTEGRTALPDFDIDYPSSRKQFMIDYAKSRWGSTHVVAVGTHLRIKNKAAFKDTARAIKSRLPISIDEDVKVISKIITAAEASTAGLGLKWDDLMDQCEEEFAPYKERYPYLFEMAEKFRGRLKTYSRHAAGLIIDPATNLENSLPMWKSPDGSLTSQFDKDELEKLGYVKFDFLNLRNLDTIQDAIDLIEANTGVRINVNKWREEYNDSQVYENICNGWTLGCFQIETNLGTRTVKNLQPKSLADISDAITLGRPGPMRSGLDRTYIRRRNGQEKAKYPDPRMEGVLAKTYGAMLYQEDIMALTMVLAGYDSNEADTVRKILGKKKPEEAKKEGVKFIERAIQNNTKEEVARSLWDQMAEFALYSFNRAHAFSYATLAYWTAWLKTHYPVEFMVACLSTVKQDEVPLYISEARRMGQQVLPPDVNESKAGFTASGSIVRFGLGAIKGVGEAALGKIIPNQPYTSFEDFVERSGVDRGVQKTLVHIGALDSLVSNRKALEARFQEEDLKTATRCVNYRDGQLNEFNLPCAFDWKSEEPKRGKTGKILKNQPKPPLKCTAGCRKFTLRPLPADEEIAPYTDEEIRNIEMELLGTYLSSSPFDGLDPEDMDQLYSADDLQLIPHGNYLMIAIITGWKDYKDKKDRLMKFLRVSTPSGETDVTAFADQVDEYNSDIRVGNLVFMEVNKNARGLTLNLLVPAR